MTRSCQGLIRLIATVALLPTMGSGSALAGQLFHRPRGQMAVALPTTVSTIPATTLQMVPTVSVPAVSTVPAVTLQAATVQAPTVTLQAAPVSPTTYTYSLQSAPAVGSAPVVYYLVQSGAAQANTAPSAAAGQGNAAAPSLMSSADVQVLSAGFGGQSSKVSALEQRLREKLQQLNQRFRGLDRQELASILLDVARAFLKDNRFGFATGGLVDDILTRLVDRVVAGPSAPPAPGPAPETQPSGADNTARTYNISGTITLTPSGGTPGGGPTPPPSPNPNPNGSGNGQGMPDQLIDEGGQAAGPPSQ